MSAEDRRHWDGRYRSVAPPAPRLPDLFAQYESFFPTSGTALDVACGTGSGALWLALRGLDVFAVDVSPVAIGLARQVARELGVSTHCRFEVADLDAGLPSTPPVDVILCHRFREPKLYPALIDRLSPGGHLAIAVLSAVGAGPGRFRAPAGELSTAFATLNTVVSIEGDGVAVLIGRKASG